MAVARAHLGGIPIVLVSATPSLETSVNADQGRYRRIHMPGRHGGAVLPEIERIDLRADRPERQRFLSPTLRRAVAGTVAAGEQAMLFLNRRGYAPRSEEHTSELQSLMRISYAVFCLKKKTKTTNN